MSAPTEGTRDAVVPRPRRGRALPSGASEQVILENERTRVRRVSLPDGDTVVVKEALGAGALARHRAEVTALDRLAGLTGVSPVSEWTEPGAIVFEDRGDRTLASELAEGPFPAARVAELGATLARVLADIHRRGVVHRDLTPSNVLVATDAEGHDHPILIDFGLAVTATEAGIVGERLHQLAGTLAYLAPEQTGRTGRLVDHRADLYSLGAVLYECACGRRPFETADQVELLHDILVRTPVPPATLDPRLPPALSDVIDRLLTKDPDQRYQSAEGLAHDLARIAANPAARFSLGEWDFPLRLSAPPGPIGRDTLVAALRTRMRTARVDGAPVLLLGGPAGVGKSALVAHLGAEVEDAGGWLMTGTADPMPAAAAFGPLMQVVAGLGRRLLAADPDDVRAERNRLRDALGTGADVVAAAVPEFIPILAPDAAPEVAPAAPAAAVEADGDATGEPETALQLRPAVPALLAAVASPARPVVVVLEDLQWADPLTLALLDAVASAGPAPGLLVVGTYRPDELHEDHPLAELVVTGTATGTVAVLEVPALTTPELAEFVARVLRLTTSAATGLAGALARTTAGNPQATLDLLDALRADGVMKLGPEGWTWDAEAVGTYVGRGDVDDLLRERLRRLPPETRTALEAMACLGGRVRIAELSAVLDFSEAVVVEALRPAQADGLVVLEDDPEPVARFPHQRVRQGVLAGLDETARSELHLRLARRLSWVLDSEARAADQYLATSQPVTDEDELHEMARLFRAAAIAGRRSGDDAGALKLLDAEQDVWRRLGFADDDPDLMRLDVERHATLYALGKLEEADAAYVALGKRTRVTLQLAGATSLQVSSLSQRNRHREAVDLGLDLAVRLGLPAGVSAAHLEDLVAWSGRLDLAADLARPVASDPRAAAIEGVLNRLLPSAFFLGDSDLVFRIVLAGFEQWRDHGPSAGLVAVLSCTGLVTGPRLDRYEVGHIVGRHMIAVGEARGWEPATSQARHRYAVQVLPWTEPLENALEQAQLAREGLLRGGDLQMANHTALVIVPARLETGRSLEAVAEEIRTATRFARRSGHPQLAETLEGFRHLTSALAAGPAVEPEPPPTSHNPMAEGVSHLGRALAALLLDDGPGLDREAEAALPFAPSVPGYTLALVRVVHAMALAARLRADGPDAEKSLLTQAELDEHLHWLSERVSEVPENFADLRDLVAAERLWALGDAPGALRGFDVAVRTARDWDRFWHVALVAERAGRCHLAFGLRVSGRRFLAEAREDYLRWGAGGKVAALDREFPGLRSLTPAGSPGSKGRSRAAVSVASTATGLPDGTGHDGLDLLAVLRACRALSSQTRVEDLLSSVVTQLATLTGATDVLLAAGPDDGDGQAGSEGWVLHRSDGPPIPVEEAVAAHLLPGTVFRYVRHTGEQLLVRDALADSRFARDPYLAGWTRCSLLAVPVTGAGQADAVLLLLNRTAAGALTEDRMDAVLLLASQLAVSLRNAQLYQSLEQRVSDRTRELAAANERLARLSVTDALTTLPNRRRFEEALEDAWNAATSDQQWLTVAMIDVDRFKNYNDHFGHPAGDECLRRVSRTLSSSFRGTSDTVCRYGGEEFVVVLPGADPAMAAMVGERARAAVSGLALPHPNHEPGIVTVSVGLASCRPGEWSGTAQELLSRADAAVYAAKSGGRNTVVVAETV